MPITRSYQSAFDVTDYTDNLLLVPNVWGLSQQLGIFQSEGITTDTASVEVISKSYGLLEDRTRGQRSMLNKDYTRKIHAFSVPHFPGDDAIYPKDLAGKRAYGEDGAERLDAVRARKLERIRMSHAATLEAGRMNAIVNGTAYAPNGTVSYNWYTEFGVTRKEVDFVLDVGTTEILAKIEEVIAHIQDNAFTGQVVGEIFALCSPEFFSALIAHPKVVDAFKYYTASQQVLRERLNAQGLDARYREFSYGGVLFIEYRGGYAGTMGSITRYIPAGDAYFLPAGGQDDFVTYFAPAQKFDLVGTVGQEAYVFEYADPKGEQIILESETNFLNVLRRPGLVVRGFA
jgi:hypothetical protein